MPKPLHRLSFTIPQRDLKLLGYKMLHNKRGYTLDIKLYAYTIWIWLSGKTIYINDWYDRSYDIIEFYKANRDCIEFKNESYIRIRYDFKSGNIILDTMHEEIMKAESKFLGLGSSKDLKQISEKFKPYKDYYSTYLEKEEMDKLIVELEKLNYTITDIGTPI